MHVDEPCRVATVEDLQTPRHRGLAAEKLLVEVVPDPADRLRENDAGCDRVAKRWKRNATTPAGYPGAHAAKGDGAPDSQSAVPDAQRRNRSGTTVAEIRPPVGRQVIQPPTDEAERHGPQRDVVDHAALATARRPASVTDQQRGDDPDDDEQGVGPQRDRPKVPHALRRAREVRDDGRRHDVEFLWRTPAASSSVSARIVDNPSVSADTSAEPTMTPSA